MDVSRETTMRQPSLRELAQEVADRQPTQVEAETPPASGDDAREQRIAETVQQLQAAPTVSRCIRAWGGNLSGADEPVLITVAIRYPMAIVAGEMVIAAERWNPASFMDFLTECGR
jgi:hypothetical protein